MNPNERATLSLVGLSVGDALGERFFGPPAKVISRIEARELPPAPWGWTDDTQMALSIFDLLRSRGSIDRDELASQFGRRYEVTRGYGRGAQGLLQGFQLGVPWRVSAPDMFNGQGSFGNGGAMRVAPLGAYFAEDLQQVVEQATRSAVVTHAHPEGIAGAIAIAVGAAAAWRFAEKKLSSAEAFLDLVLDKTPDSMTRQRLMEVSSIPPSVAPAVVADQVGSGQEIAAHDTVPFALWCAAHNLNSYEEAFWATVSGLGDRDTTCAMVGGIVALSSGQVPAQWVKQREPLPEGF